MIDQGFLFRLPPQTQHGTVTVEFMNRAIEAEREECAKVADEYSEQVLEHNFSKLIAHNIRARGQA